MTTFTAPTNTIDLSRPVPCWPWNGYNSQWVYSLEDRSAVFESAMVESDKIHHERTVLLEDDEFTTVITRRAYQFHGWREETTIHTTRPGAIVGYEDHDRMWLPDATNAESEQSKADALIRRMVDGLQRRNRAMPDGVREFTGASFAGKDLRWKNLSHHTFIQCDFAGANLNSADLSSAKFINCNLSGADLRGAFIWNARFSGSNITDVQADGPIWGHML